MDEPFENFRDFKAEIDTFRIENDNLKRDYDKVTIDYEWKIKQLKKDIDLKTVSYENLMINFQELDAQYRNSCQEKISINQEYFDLSQEKFNIVKKFDNLESEHTTLLELVSRLEKELLHTKNETQDLRVLLTEYKNKEIESKLNTNELEYRKKDFEQMEQISLLRSKKLLSDVKSLEEKLTESVKVNHEEKANHNREMYEMNLEIESKRTEIKHFKKSNEKLKEQISYLEKVNEEKNESLRSAVEGQTNIDILLRKELNVQTSINEVLKEKLDEYENKEETLINAIKELQDSLKESFEESEKMKSEFELKLREYAQQVGDLRKEINSKDKELVNANELLEKFRVKSLSEEELKVMNPATAASISALKRGYSMTQIYSEYLQVVNEKDELRVDRDRLNEYMMSILEELEKKAPLIKKQQEEHSNLELSVSTLAKKYDENLSNMFTCQSELEASRKKCDEMARTLKREERTCSDLSQQVCCLLREIETYRGTVIRSDDSDPAIESNFITRRRSFHQRSLMMNSQSSFGANTTPVEAAATGNKYVTANDVITTHLVTFKNICELQEQNRNLLEQFRDLSEQQEATETLINENSLQELAKKLEDAYREIDDIKEKHKQNKHLKKTIHALKHIIQALTMFGGKSDLSSLIENSLLNFDGTDENAQSLITVQDGAGDKRVHQSNLNTISTLNEKISEYKDKINAMQADIDRLRNEKEFLKDKHATIIDELNEKSSDLKVVNANLMAKISFNQEKSSSLEQNLINRQLELSDLQNDLLEVNRQFSQKNEENQSLSNELKSCQLQLKEYESELKRMQYDIKHAESLEEQLNNEKSEKYKLMTSISQMANQLSNIQAHLSKPQLDQSSEDQIELKSKIKQLTLELKQEKSKFQSSFEMWQAKFNESSSIIDSLKSQINNDTRPTSSNLMISESCTIGILQSIPEKREKTGDLETQLEDLTVSNCSLKKQVESYQDLMANSESKLISNAQLIEEMEARFQDRIDELIQSKNGVEELLENVQLSNRELQTEMDSKQADFASQIAEMTKILEDKSNLIDSLNNDIAILKTKECQLKSDLERQRRLTKEATANYQQELIYHSQESNILEELREQMNKSKKHERDLTEKLQEAILLRDRYKSDLDQRDNIWLAEKELFEKEIGDLRVQRDSLNNRLIDLNDHVVNLKKMLDPSIESGIDHAVIQRESDWNEVIQYLRQEKESAERLKNQFEIDTHKLKGQCRQQEEAIEQLNKSLEEERRFRVEEEETRKQHAEIMRDMESKQMLMESNAKLRLDRETVKEQLSEKAEKLERLQESIEPLKTELKLKNNEIESVKLDARSLENERDLWRRRCDALIEKSKQINPEEFKHLCMEKDELEHQLLLEEEKYRTQIEELQSQIENFNKSIKDKENQLESIKKINDENVTVIQKRDSLITQLKDIGRKYKTEAESLTSEIVKVTDEKDNKVKEIQSLKRELMETKVMLDESRREFQHLNQTNSSSTSNSLMSDEFVKKLGVILQCQHNVNEIIESADKLFQENQNNTQLLEKLDSEQKLRNQVIEGQIFKYKQDNERLKKQVESLRLVNSSNQEEDNGVSEENNTTTEVIQTTAWHAVPTVARVAANVHPVVQKPQNIVSGSNQISPNSQPISTCTSTARQTAEIRPIPAVALHIAPSSSTVENSDSVSTASVTTSLPANVVQALAASSVSTVIFPAVSAFPSSSSTSSTSAGVTSSNTSNINRMKRCFEETLEPESRNIMEESTSVEQSGPKKIRIRVPDQTIQTIQEPVNQDSNLQEPPSNLSVQLMMTTTTTYNSLQDLDEVCEGEVEIESEDIENIEITDEEEDNNKMKSDLEEIMIEERSQNFSDVENSVEEEEFEEENYGEDENDEDNDDDNDDGNDDDDDDEDDEDDDDDANDHHDHFDEDDEEDDDEEDDDNPDVIDLLSSDENAGDNLGSGDNNNKYDDEDDNADYSSTAKEDKKESNTDEEMKNQETEFEQAKKKIEPIVWTESNQRKNYLLSNMSNINNSKANYITTPPKLGQPIKSRYSGNSGFRRKISTSRRNFPFVVSGGRGMSVGRRSGPFKGTYPAR